MCVGLQAGESQVKGRASRVDVYGGLVGLACEEIFASPSGGEFSLNTEARGAAFSWDSLAEAGVKELPGDTVRLKSFRKSSLPNT